MAKRKFCVVEAVADSSDDVEVTVVYEVSNIKEAKELAIQMYIEQCDPEADDDVRRDYETYARDTILNSMSLTSGAGSGSCWSVHIVPIEPYKKPKRKRA